MTSHKKPILVGKHSSRILFSLRQHITQLMSNLAHNGESSGSLSVQAHVLGVRLSQTDQVTVLKELTNGKSVGVNIAC